MYYIKKYVDCWAVYNDDNGQSRPLSQEEKGLVIEELRGSEENYMRILDDRVVTVFIDRITSVNDLP